MKMIKVPYIWKNWKLIKWDEALDHNLTHSLHYWSWVFEWIRFYPTKNWPKVFRLKEHIDRLFYSASVVGMDIPFSKEEIMQGVLDVVKNAWIDSGYIRPLAYYGYWQMGLNPIGAPVEVVISAWGWWKYLSDKPIRVKIPSVRRIDPQTIPMWAKICWNYANSILASLEIKKGGFDEALLLDTQGFIAEWPGENIFFIKWNEVFTPVAWTILPGITRDTIIKILDSEFRIKVKETRIHPNQLKDFDEAFFVGTAAEVTLIGSITDIDNTEYKYQTGIETLSSKIKNFYTDLVHWKYKKYNNWLS